MSLYILQIFDKNDKLREERIYYDEIDYHAAIASLELLDGWHTKVDHYER